MESELIFAPLNGEKTLRFKCRIISKHFGVTLESLFLLRISYSSRIARNVPLPRNSRNEFREAVTCDFQRSPSLLPWLSSPISIEIPPRCMRNPFACTSAKRNPAISGPRVCQARLSTDCAPIRTIADRSVPPGDPRGVLRILPITGV